VDAPAGIASIRLRVKPSLSVFRVVDVSVHRVSYEDSSAKQAQKCRDCFNHLTVLWVRPMP
jgi:hypothetical protein